MPEKNFATKEKNTPVNNGSRNAYQQTVNKNAFKKGF
jgi:hypothetical protein